MKPPFQLSGASFQLACRLAGGPLPGEPGEPQSPEAERRAVGELTRAGLLRAEGSLHPGLLVMLVILRNATSAATLSVERPSRGALQLRVAFAEGEWVALMRAEDGRCSIMPLPDLETGASWLDGALRRLGVEEAIACRGELPPGEPKLRVSGVFEGRALGGAMHGAWCWWGPEGTRPPTQVVCGGRRMSVRWWLGLEEPGSLVDGLVPAGGRPRSS